ncbi:MAG: DUF6089 family protein [Chitinophagales bacterium]|nr:DUF6089 family protein [Chitinophagales bacterium]
MLYKLKLHISWVFFLLCVIQMKAQISEYGVFIAATNYFGDLNPNYSFKQSRAGGGLFYRYNFNNRMAMRIGISHAWIAASDEKLSTKQPYLSARNLSFNARVTDLGGLFELNFFDWDPDGSAPNKVKKKKKWTPYIFGGISFYHFRNYTFYQGGKYDLAPVGTEGQKNPNSSQTNVSNGYGPYSVSLPFGGGLKFSLTRNLTLQVEMMTRRSFNDNLDDVSKNYADASQLNYYVDGRNMSEILSDRSPEKGIIPIGIPGKQRGSSKDNDRFNFYSVGITYSFNKIKCPTF